MHQFSVCRLYWNVKFFHICTHIFLVFWDYCLGECHILFPSLISCTLSTATVHLGWTMTYCCPSYQVFILQVYTQVWMLVQCIYCTHSWSNSQYQTSTVQYLKCRGFCFIINIIQTWSHLSLILPVVFSG